jgi:hypothetical protein
VACRRDGSGLPPGSPAKRQALATPRGQEVPLRVDFPPLDLGAAATSSTMGSSLAEFMLQVGSWSFSLPAEQSAWSVARSGTPSYRPDPEVPRVAEERDDVEPRGPLIPISSRIPYVSRTTEDPGTQVAIPSKASPGTMPAHLLGSPLSGPARMARILSRLLKWAWRLVGTLDPTLFFPASTPDLQRVCLPPYLTRVLLLPVPPRASSMERGCWEDRGAGKGAKISRDPSRKPYRWRSDGWIRHQRRSSIFYWSIRWTPTIIGANMGQISSTAFGCGKI